MPKIKLKPGTAEFEDTRPSQASEVKICDMPGCQREGKHRAPKDRALSEYYHFCQEHAREYNKAWNFFDGMADADVEEHMINAMYGDRPTWRYDQTAAKDDILRTKAWQAYNFTDKGRPEDDNTHRFAGTNHSAPEIEALAIMGLEPPITLDVIKEKYKMLAKKHHPDLNKGCEKSEELLKQINMAYTILKLAYEQFEELPERT